MEYIEIPALRRLMLAVMGAALSAPVDSLWAADIVNGWSPQASIASVYSLNTSTMFRLSGVLDGCGHADFWVLPLDESARAKAKLSILVAAHAAGKKVSLRCENSVVTDFQVLE